MMMRALFLASAAVALAVSSAAFAAPDASIRNSVAVCNPNNPQRCLLPNADGSINTTATGSGANAAAGTTGNAPPTYADYTGFQNSAGNLVGVSPTNPLPTTAALTGSAGNNSDSVAPTITNVPATSYNYGFNGTSWDRLLETAGQLQVRDYGSAGTLFQQGNAAAASANSQNVFIGGRFGSADGVAPVVPADPVAGIDQGGLKRTLAVGTTGILDSPRSSGTTRVTTRTSVAINTSTTVCPVSPNITAITVYLPISGTGVGWDGQALTTSTPGTAATTPQFVTAAANFTWAPTVPPTNAITVYSPTAFVAVCVQDVRQ